MKSTFFCYVLSFILFRRVDRNMGDQVWPEYKLVIFRPPLKSTMIFYKVPRSTLKWLCWKKDVSTAQAISTKLGRNPTLGIEIKHNLSAYLLVVVTTFFVCTLSNLRRITVTVADLYGIKNPWMKPSENMWDSICKSSCVHQRNCFIFVQFVGEKLMINTISVLKDFTI